MLPTITDGVISKRETTRESYNMDFLRHFVPAWNKAETKDDVCEKMGITKSTASALASQLRKKGVTLKMFAHVGRSSDRDYNELRELAGISLDMRTIDGQPV